ncbi:olfactory receptor 11A1-like [Hyperolius riggenbachi]|uniref:olfactory receptor 11A1-like n=1 Tax=Hyperolius riggenbachi TaxID=752182 RepID=UPI0035A2E419
MPAGEEGPVWLIAGAWKATYKNNVTTIIFLGFQNMGKLNILFFTFVLTIYCVTLCGNFLIVVLVSCSKTLHSPMYFFLTQLSIADVILITDVAPNILSLLLHEWTSMSFSGCISQYYFFGSTETFECFLLTVMSYDRYLAICSPLHYGVIMDHTLCTELILASWVLSFLFALALTLAICQLQFCGPNSIDHFFCDFNPLVKLSCSDVSKVRLELTLLCIPVIFVPFLMILISYIYIVLTVLKISSISGRQKTFSTCGSHLAIVCIFYGTLMSIYMIPKEGQSKIISKIFPMLYTIGTPFLNPLIYTLRNKVITEALRKALYN